MIFQKWFNTFTWPGIIWSRNSVLWISTYVWTKYLTQFEKLEWQWYFVLVDCLSELSNEAGTVEYSDGPRCVPSMSKTMEMPAVIYGPTRRRHDAAVATDAAAVVDSPEILSRIGRMVRAASFSTFFPSPSVPARKLEENSWSRLNHVRPTEIDSCHKDDNCVYFLVILVLIMTFSVFYHYHLIRFLLLMSFLIT